MPPGRLFSKPLPPPTAKTPAFELPGTAFGPDKMMSTSRVEGQENLLEDFFSPGLASAHCLSLLSDHGLDVGKMSYYNIRTS